jgi:hopanoid biosynthesis associated radical SAM protein HpnH
MRYPLGLSLSMAWHLARKKLQGARRFPLVLMLEPTHRCNLACQGCGRIREYKDTLDREMSVLECLKAAYECDAPIVSVCGGEPLLHSRIGELVHELLVARRYVYLCTNGLLLRESLAKFEPRPDFIINVHVDGLPPTHDRLCGREGVFNETLEGIREAKRRGFLVCTNTTIYRGTDLREIERLFDLLQLAGVDGFLISPGFAYEPAKQDVMLDRDEMSRHFAEIGRLSTHHSLWNTPLYLAFLAGKMDLKCVPWGNPTRTPQGWRSPCYLVCERHYPRFADLMEQTDWSRFTDGRNPACRNCRVHSGFEPAAVMAAMSSFRSLAKMLRWTHI